MTVTYLISLCMLLRKRIIAKLAAERSFLLIIIIADA